MNLFQNVLSILTVEKKLWFFCFLWYYGFLKVFLVYQELEFFFNFRFNSVKLKSNFYFFQVDFGCFTINFLGYVFTSYKQTFFNKTL